ncbi:hypothetical protein PIB30_078237, partial [Stylosanthes scabra]|nr:hypothetical protein [Stylosanthes scabra]
LKKSPPPWTDKHSEVVRFIKSKTFDFEPSKPSSIAFTTTTSALSLIPPLLKTIPLLAGATAATACQDHLWLFSTLIPDLAKITQRMRLPVMKFGGQIMYSRTFADVEKAAEMLLKILEEKKRAMMQIPLGFDIEWKASFRSGWFSCFSFCN